MKKVVLVASLVLFWLTASLTAPGALANTNLPAAPTAAATGDASVLFSDDFSGPCNLPRYQDDEVAVKCEAGEYTMQNLAPDRAWRVNYPDELTDAVMEVDAHVISGPRSIEYGVSFRQSADKNSYYLFTITREGRFGLFRYVSPNYFEVAPYTDSTAIKTGTATNHLKVVAQGSQFSLFANGELLATASDPSLAKGTFGFYIASSEPGAKVGFDNVRVSRTGQAAPASSPTTPRTPTRTSTPTATRTPSLASATSTGTATTSASAAPTSSPTALFTDDFSGPCNLPVSKDEDTVRKCEGGEYTLEIKRRDTALRASYLDEYTDAVIEVDARVIAGPPDAQYGLIFRQSRDGNQYYVVLLTQDGNYFIGRYARPDWANLTEFTPSDAVKTGHATNHLKVIVQGQTITAFANDQLLATVSDASLSKGFVGVFGGTSEGGAKLAFDNVRISAVGQPVPPPAGTGTPTRTPTRTPTPPTSATPTRTLVGTASATPKASPTGASGQTNVVFKDPYNLPCSLPEGDNAARTLACENGEYTILSKTKGGRWVYYSDTYTDSVVEVDAHAISGPPYIEYGLVLRVGPSGDPLYGVSISNDGRYSVFAFEKDKFDDLMPLTGAAAIKKGTARNHLKVIAQGNQLALYVNDQWLTTVTNSRFAEGAVGLFVYQEEANAKVGFDNLQVSEILKPFVLPQP